MKFAKALQEYTTLELGNYIATVLNEMKLYDEEIKYWKEGIDIHKQFSSPEWVVQKARFKIAQALFALEKYPEALIAFKNSMQNVTTEANSFFSHIKRL